MINSWKKLSSEVINKNPFSTFSHDRFLMPTGVEGDYFYLTDVNSVLIVPLAADSRLLLVNSYRYLFDKYSLEFPGGAVKQGQTFEQAARDELLEECGVEAREMINIGEFNPYNGLCTEICRVYLARGLMRREAQPDATEQLEAVTRRLDELEDLIRRNDISDGMTLAAWSLARKHIIGN